MLFVDRADFIAEVAAEAGSPNAAGFVADLETYEGAQAAVAFAMYPVTLGDLMAIADAGAIMPPKSTWFEPKLRDGLLAHEI